jgi:hypothetical protein
MVQNSGEFGDLPLRYLGGQQLRNRPMRRAAAIN